MGAGWPNNYQEITPLCDAFLIDMKVWSNLWEETWSNPALELGNAGFSSRENPVTVIDYTVDANLYGGDTDPYLIAKKEVNPHFLNLTKETSVREKDLHYDTIVIKADYMKDSHYLDFTYVPDLNPYKTANVSRFCPEEKCVPENKIHFFDYAGANKTEHRRDPSDPKFLTTNSELPLLPRFDGFIGTHGERLFFLPPFFGQRP